MPLRGIDLRFQSNPSAIEKTPSGLRVTLEDGGTLETDQIMMAVGRVPNTANLAPGHAPNNAHPNPKNVPPIQ